MLLIEQDGPDAEAVSREMDRTVEFCRSHGAYAVRIATDPTERERLWQGRRDAAYAMAEVRPNKLSEDIVVPRDKIPEMVRQVERISAEVRLPIAVFGHAGDGNLHPNVLFDRNDAGEAERAEVAASAILHAALQLGGMLSGEHGVGTFKREYLVEALGSDAVELMRGIKDLFDPAGLLNPGKIFPTGEQTIVRSLLG